MHSSGQCRADAVLSIVFEGSGFALCNTMPLSNPPSGDLYYMNFNQDYTCLSIADSKGIKIWSLSTHKLCYVADIGAVR